MLKTPINQQSVCSNVFILRCFFSESEHLPVFLDIIEPTLRRGETLNVTKKGKSTGVTYGSIDKTNYHTRVESSQKGTFYAFKKCYRIRPLNREIFFEDGDSGAGVFLIDEQTKTLKPLGIGFLKGPVYTCVCRIKHFLDEFQLSICEDDFARNYFGNKTEKE